MLAFRDAVIKELKERVGVRALAEAPPTYDSASVGMVESAITLVKEKVRTLVIPTRELHGVVMAWRWLGVCVLLVRSFPVL